MKKLLLSLLLLGLIIIACLNCFANNKELSTNEDKIAEFSFGGVELYDPHEKVEKILGKPRSIDNEGDQWIYEGIRVGFEQGKVSSIFVNSPRYHTFRGIRVGDHKDKVKELYPEAWVFGDYDITYCEEFNKRELNGIIILRTHKIHFGFTGDGIVRIIIVGIDDQQIQLI